MTDPDNKAYFAGHRAAVNAIRDGFPRWVLTENPQEESIDSRTGLPVMTISSPRELQSWNESFARGNNDEILRAIRSGEIKRDFRPLQMTFSEVQHSLEREFLGTLSSECPQLNDPRGRFAIRLQTPKPRKVAADSKTARDPLDWVVLEHAPNGPALQLLIYESPVHLALGRNGRVILMKTPHVYLVLDAETSQVLNRYRVHGACAGTR